MGELVVCEVDEGIDWVAGLEVEGSAYPAEEICVRFRMVLREAGGSDEYATV